MAGFEYRYRLGGGDPTYHDFAVRDGGVTSGDLVNFEDGNVDLGATGDTALLGVAHDVSTGGSARVIVDPDAVYAIADPHPRRRGAAVDLDGATGAQALAVSVNGDLSVVADCAADEETLVRISPGKHHELSADGGARRSGGELNAALARAVVRSHRENFGRGPTEAHAFYRGNVIVVVLRDTMTKAERTLASLGKIDTVMNLRSAFQESIRADLTAVVEDLTGAKVLAFMSSNHVDPDLASEIFVLDRPVPGEPQ